MSGIKIVAIVMIALGILALVYGQFSYTKKTQEAELGPLKIAVKEKSTINIPTWLGVGVIAAGTVLLLVRKKK